MQQRDRYPTKKPQRFEDLDVHQARKVLLALEKYQAWITVKLKPGEGESFNRMVKLFSTDFPKGKVFQMSEFLCAVINGNITSYMETSKNDF